MPPPNIVTLLVLLVLGAALGGSAVMVWIAYRKPVRPIGSGPSADRAGESGARSAILERVERRIAGIDPGLELALRTRCEIAQRLPGVESVLALQEVLYDLERLGAEAAPGPAPAPLTGLLARVIDANPADRAGILAREIIERFRGRLSHAVGGDFATRLMNTAPGLPATDADWPGWVADGSMAKWFEAIIGASANGIGRSPLIDLAERAAREVGTEVPLSCFPVLLAGLCEGCLSAEKTHASVRESLWNEFLGARRDLDAARVRLTDADLNKWATVGRLAAGVAHEINNPAAFVLANASLAVEHVEKLRRYHEEIHALVAADPAMAARLAALDKSAGAELLDRELRDMSRDSVEGILRIGAIVRDLQSFSRAAAFAPVATELNPLVESVINMARLEIRDRAVVERDFGESVTVPIDPVRISQVLMNLLVNALHAIPSSQTTPARITIRTGTDVAGAFVVVEDEGTGIAPGVLPHIFDPFFTTKPIGKGTGLGLAIGREIVERHGGSLTVESELGKGSRFRLWLPRVGGARAPTPARGTPAAAARPIAPEAARKRARILVIDDEPQIRKAFERLLRAHYDAVCAEAKEGLAMIDAGREFDVLFVDLAMPGMTGREFHRELEARHPKLASRVVFLFGGASAEEMAELARDFPGRYLLKPATSEQIKETIGRISGS